MLRRVALERTDVSKELSASCIRVTRIGELGTTLAVTSNRRELRVLYVPELYNLSPISLIISCKLSFPNFGLKTPAYFGIEFSWKNYIWYLGNESNIFSSSS
jgi:hypothetical protein